MDKKKVEQALIAKNIKVSYGDNEVLRDVSLKIAGNEIVALIGRSGCGKSTLLRALCSLQETDEGDINLHGEKIIEKGKPLFEEWEIRRNIMMVPQEPSLLPHMTVRKNIRLGIRLNSNLNKKESNDATEEIASDIGIKDILDKYPEEISGGQAQRTQLARVVVLRPDILLLDEVSSSIDPQTTFEVVQALWKMKKLKSGKEQAILIVTHLIKFACEFADRILFLEEGIIYEEGKASSFLEDAKKEKTKIFFMKYNYSLAK